MGATVTGVDGDHPSSAAFVEWLENLACIHDVPHGDKVVRWRSFGQGSPLVLIHGGHGSWLHWVRNILPLSASHRVLVPDLPGYGDSQLQDGPSADPTGLDLLLEALHATLLRLVGAEPFDLAGFSFGGVVATHLAARCASVRRLCLLGPGGHGMARRQVEALQDWRKAPDAQAAAAAFRQNLSSFMLHALDPADTLAPLVYERACRATRFRSKEISRRAGALELIARLPCPVLALWGEHDVTAHPAEVGEALRQGRADRDWCLVSGAGHWVQYERAQAVNQILLTWLRAR